MVIYIYISSLSSHEFSSLVSSPGGWFLAAGAAAAPWAPWPSMGSPVMGLKAPRPWQDEFGEIELS